MTLGRPSSLRTTESVPLPSPVDDEYLDKPREQAVQPSGTISINMFAVQNSKAIKLLSAILDQVYYPLTVGPSHSGQSMPTTESLSATFSLDSQLDDFEKSAIDALTPIDQAAAQNAGVLKRQRNVLHTRSVVVEESTERSFDV